jgi:hypothetical protein
MAQFHDQTDTQTDAFPLAHSRPTKAGSTTNTRKVVGITAATLLLGGAAWAVTQRIQEKQDEQAMAAEDSPTASPPAVDLPADIDVAGKVTDDMPFDKAFEAARQEVGMGGVFGWHGRWYNTFEKEEWTSLSLEQRQEYTEMVTGEKLPVKPYGQTPTQTPDSQLVSTTDEPTVIEGYLNGQRVMGLDFDEDGVIDTLVMDGPDGNTYRVVDATGDAGLDTVYQYDSLDGELTGMVRLDQSFVLTNDDFSQHLENAMAREVVESILEPDVPSPAPTTDTTEDSSDVADDDSLYLANASLTDEDTYNNNGDVRDMDE